MCSRFPGGENIAQENVVLLLVKIYHYWKNVLTFSWGRKSRRKLEGGVTCVRLPPDLRAQSAPALALAASDFAEAVARVETTSVPLRRRIQGRFQGEGVWMEIRYVCI